MAVGAFADHYHITDAEAETPIRLGRSPTRKSNRTRRTSMTHIIRIGPTLLQREGPLRVVLCPVVRQPASPTAKLNGQGQLHCWRRGRDTDPASAGSTRRS